MMFPIFAVLFWGTILAVALRGLERREQNILLGSFVAHIAAAFAQIWIHRGYYEGGDMLAYSFHGEQIAYLLERNFKAFAPEVARLAFHMQNDLPIAVLGEGLTTGTMSAVVGFLYFLFGSSIYGGCLFIGSFACVGLAFMHKAAREVVRPDERALVAATLTLVPSVVFWTSAIAKEAFAMGALGFLTWTAHGLLVHRRVWLLPVTAASAATIALIKPYILFPLVLGLAAWFWSTRRRRSWLWLIVAVALALGGLAAIGSLFPEFTPENIGKTAANQQYAGGLARGGSFTEIGDMQERTLAGQLRFMPLGLLNALTRPLLIEARNPPMLVAALEMTVLLVVFLRLLIRFKPRTVFTNILRSPILLFSLVFVVTFGAAVGLVTTNLGTLNRYRVPMMPFFATSMFVLRNRLRAPGTVTAPGRVPSPGAPPGGRRAHGMPGRASAQSLTGLRSRPPSLRRAR